MQVFIGLGIAAAISFTAYRLRLLNGSGAAAATGLGAIVFGFGGLSWAVVLVAFFATSSGLTRLFGNRKQDLAASFSKGGRRDAWQVLANGGLPGLAVLAHAALPDGAWPWAAFCGALAAVTADTWATELGVLGRSAPRLITNLRPVARGTSGGVSLAGTLAALAGALVIAILGALLGPGAAMRFILAVAAGGLIGSLVDSMLGATLQAIYFCPACGKETERHPLHTCGSPTELRSGLAWLNNDGVNALCGLAGGIAAVVLVGG